jgi:hypothetical protein
LPSLSILENHLDSQPRTKDDDEDEQEDQDRTLNLVHSEILAGTKSGTDVVFVLKKDERFLFKARNKSIRS